MSRRGRVILPAILVCTGLPCRMEACEPVLPLMQVVGGPFFLSFSFAVLFAAVFLKMVAFAFFQKSLSFARALGLMLLGNVVTTIVGAWVGAMIASWVWVVGLPLAWVVCLPPARRFIATIGQPAQKTIGAGWVATFMCAALCLSCILFEFARGVVDSPGVWRYWILKFVGLYVALLVSILISAFWEEWVIWRFASREASDGRFVQPVLRANLLVLLCIMAFAAAVMIPKRLQAPRFLVTAKEAGQTK